VTDTHNTAETSLRMADVVSQEQFGAVVGISQQAVSDLMGRGVIMPNQSLGEWLIVYCSRLRTQASGRDSEGTLAKERALLSRSQREGQELKNAVTRGEYAPIGLLGDVLAVASAAVVDRFDALPGQLRKACPDLPSEARDAISKTIASARNEWIRSTAELVDLQLEERITDQSDDDLLPDAEEEGAAT
jgi:phage terminase Nu1 subunit (DNA packaging protein)